MQYASFGKRLIAYMIDSFIVSLIAGIPAACLVTAASAIIVGMNIDEELIAIALTLIAVLAVFIGVLAGIFYYAMMWSRSGQTLGKKWLGIKVVTAEWTPPSFWRALGRATFGYWISAFVFSVGFFWMLWDDYQQCWHDKLFGTYVIEA